MNEEQQFIDTIQANKNDADLRRVYADWCEERGEMEKANFLRFLADECETQEYGNLDVYEIRLFHLIDVGLAHWSCQVDWRILKYRELLQNASPTTPSPQQ